MAAGLVGQGQARDCKTAAPYTGDVVTRAAEACIRLDPTRMGTIATTTNAWIMAGGLARDGFTTESFGSVANQPYITVEVTNPINIEVTAGNSQAVRYTQLTATVLVQMKSSAATAAESAVAGRGRLTVGPSLAGGGAPANF